MHAFGLLCITRVYGKPNYMAIKDAKCVPRARATKMHKWSSCKQERMSVVGANKRCMRAVHANHDAHGSTLMSSVYTRAINMNFYVIDLSCTRRLCSCRTRV